MFRARICKRLKSLGIDSKESIPPVYVAWRAGTSNRAGIDSCASIFKLLMSLGFDSKELIPPAYEAWRTGTATLFLLCS